MQNVAKSLGNQITVSLALDNHSSNYLGLVCLKKDNSNLITQNFNKSRH